MVDEINFRNIGSIRNYFKTVLEKCSKGDRSSADIQNAALSALSYLTSQMNKHSNISHDACLVLSEKVRQVENLFPIDSVPACYARHLLEFLPNPSIMRPKSPLFKFDPEGYVRNNRFSPKDLEKVQVGIVENIKVTIQRTLAEGELDQCLDILMPNLGKEREMIAEMQGTPQSHFFGDLRSKADVLLPTPISSDGPYREHGHYFLNALSALIEESGDELQTTGIHLKGPKVHEFTSFFHCHTENKEALLNSALCNQLSETDFILVKKLKDYFGDSLEETLSPSSKMLIVARLNLETSEAVLPLSQYLLFLDKEKIKQGVVEFDETVMLIVLHQSPDLHVHTEKELNKYFMRSVLSTTQKELKENVAVFRYLFAHMAPYSRGSAMVAELIERALYGYHNYSCKYGLCTEKERSLADLDALLTTTMDDYMYQYLSKIQLEKINS